MALLYLIRVAQRMRGLAVVYLETHFLSEIFILLLVSIFQSFYIAYLVFALLGDLICLGYCIMLCDNCVLVLLLLECILSLCFRTLILVCTNA